MPLTIWIFGRGAMVQLEAEVNGRRGRRGAARSQGMAYGATESRGKLYALLSRLIFDIEKHRSRPICLGRSFFRKRRNNQEAV